jgi:hypothetical protein
MEYLCHEKGIPVVKNTMSRTGVDVSTMTAAEREKDKLGLTQETGSAPVMGVFSVILLCQAQKNLK